MLCLRTTEFDVEAHPYSPEHLHRLCSSRRKKEKHKRRAPFFRQKGQNADARRPQFDGGDECVREGRQISSWRTRELTRKKPG